MKKHMDFYMVFDPIRRQNELAGQRVAALDEAAAALEANNQADYTAAMEKVSTMDTELGNISDFIAAQAAPTAPAQTPAEARELAETRAADLLAGRTVTFDAAEVRASILSPYNSVTLGTGSIVEPTRGGSSIRDRLAPVSSIIDEVSVVDLSGSSGILEPYVKSEQAAQAGSVTALAGTARTASDPVFGKVQIKSYEVNVTSYADRNISRLSPVNYEAKIRSLAMQSLRRKAASLIYSGDGQASPDMYGIKTAKNTDNEAMYAVKSVAAGTIEATTLQLLYFAYGGDTELGGSARLYLTKADLAAIGTLRGANEKRRLFDIEPEEGNPNRGVIRDGGFIVPYTLSSDLVSLSAAEAGASAVQTMLYGNPLAYELGLFGGYSIRISEDYKAGERLLTILGDVTLGGNIVVDNSFVIATVPANG